MTIHKGALSALFALSLVAAAAPAFADPAATPNAAPAAAPATPAPTKTMHHSAHHVATHHAVKKVKAAKPDTSAPAPAAKP